MASKRHIKRRSCLNKQEMTKDQAYAAVRRLGSSLNQQNVYKCKFGDHYHIGRPSKKIKQAKAAAKRARANAR